MTDTHSCQPQELTEARQRLSEAIDEVVRLVDGGDRPRMITDWVVVLGMQSAGECGLHTDESQGYIQADATTDYAALGLLHMCTRMVNDANSEG